MPLKWLHIIEILFLLSTPFFAFLLRESLLSANIPDFYAILFTLKFFYFFYFPFTRFLLFPVYLYKNYRHIMRNPTDLLLRYF